MRTFAPARARCGERSLQPRRLVVDAQRDAVGRDVAALVGGRERDLVRARRRARRSARSRCTIPPGASVAGERRAVDRQLHEPERARPRRAAARARRCRARASRAPGVGVPSCGRREVEAQPARRRRAVSAPGAPMSSAWAASRSRTRCATLPAPPAAATSPHRSAAAPPTWGAAHDVPPHALIASDSGIAGRDEDVRRRGDVGLEAAVVGRALRGVRLGQQRRRVERGDRERAARVARRGGARGGDPRGRRQVHAAVERQPRRRRRADAPDRRGSTCPAAASAPGGMSACGSGSAIRPFDWIGSPCSGRARAPSARRPCRARGW